MSKAPTEAERNVAYWENLKREEHEAICAGLIASINKYYPKLRDRPEIIAMRKTRPPGETNG